MQVRTAVWRPPSRLLVPIGLLASALLAITVALPQPGEAGKLRKTVTKGKICDGDGFGDPNCQKRSVKQMKTFFPYHFVGKTKRARKGQRVVFEYRERGNERWRKIGRGSNNAFGLQPEDRPSDRLNRKRRWRVDFSAQLPGRFKLRARFPKQKNRKGSKVVRAVEVAFND